jgi:ATP-binding cassette subfamily B protein
MANRAEQGRKAHPDSAADWLHSDGDPADARKLRGSLRMVGDSLRLVWQGGRKEFLLVAAMELVQGFGAFVFIIQIQQIISGLLSSGQASSLSLTLNLLLFIGANILMGIAATIVNNQRQIIGEKITMYVSGRIVQVVSYAELSDFDDARFHNRLSRSAMSAVSRPMQLVQTMISISQNLLSLIFVWAALVYLQPWVALSLVLIVIPIWIGGTRGGRQYFAFIHDQAEGDRLRGYLYSLLVGRDPAKEIRALGLADYLSTRWRASTAGRINEMTGMLRRRLRASLISTLGSTVVLGIAAFGLVTLNRAGVMNLAQTAAVASALLLFSQRLLNVVGQSNDYFEAAPFVRALNEFLALEPSLVKDRSGVAFAGRFDRIDIDDVSFTYWGTERPAVNGLSLSIKAGEVVALVGENGSGKTTLAKLLAGLYTPQGGAIRVDGVRIDEMDSRSWHAAVAVMFQDFNRYAFDAAENVHLGAAGRELDMEEIRAAARAAGADGFLSSLPHGYESILSPTFTKGVDLSLGQWQRIALARTFYRDSPLVILDEPSASLDARAERELFESVRNMYENKTVLLISHRFSTVRTADRIIVLNGGKIVEQGSHAQLMAASGLYAELFSMQASAFLDDDDTEADEPSVSASPR